MTGSRDGIWAFVFSFGSALSDRFWPAFFGGDGVVVVDGGGVDSYT